MTFIRPAFEGDFDAIADVWWRSWRHAGVDLDDDIAQEDLRCRIDQEMADGWRLFVAEKDRDIVGMLALAPREARLDQLFIAPERQREGLGGALLDQAKSIFSDGMTLRTAAANSNAIAFYRAHGFALDREEGPPQRRRNIVWMRWTP
ncbi:MAG: GNAT family N-acetyltransferase [Planctomycetota bacterium]